MWAAVDLIFQKSLQQMGIYVDNFMCLVISDVSQAICQY